MNELTDLISQKKQPKAIPKATFKELLVCRITDATQITTLQTIVSIGGSLFCVTGEMSFISGKPKAGKTSVAGVILSTCLAQTSNFDTLGIEGTFCEDKPIIYIDSEQSLRSSKQIIERVKRNLGISKMPPNLYVFNFRHLQPKQLREAFEVLLKELPNAFLWFLDGISDMVDSVNNEVDSKEIIHFLNNAVEKHKTAMILFLHENSTSSSDKMRGHLGSEAQRKCFATISISKDRAKQIHTIKSVEIREGKNFEDILFRFDETTKSMVMLTGSDHKKAKIELATDVLNFKYRDLIFFDETITRQEYIKRIMEFDKCSDKTAIKKILQTLEQNLIVQEKKSNNQIYFSLNLIYNP